LPDSSDESDGGIVEAKRQVLHDRRTREVEEAEGLLAREMETRRPGCGGSEEEVPPSNEPINAPSSNEPINSSPSNEQQEEDEEVLIHEEEARAVLNEQCFFNQHNDNCKV
jgi:hypothetical protein